MAMYMTREMLNAFKHHIYQNVAKKLEIPDGEWKSVQELSTEIESADLNVAGLVESMIYAYEAWYSVHEEIDQTGIAGSLTVVLNDKLIKAINNRDDARKQLIDALPKVRGKNKLLALGQPSITGCLQ